MKPVYFISDLHLSPSDPATEEAFAIFLAGPARQAQSLYILGDLFEYWIGDDQLDDPFFARQCRRIVTLAASGVAVYFMAGNRDFLCARQFALACGLTLLPDPYVADIESEKILLSHGDLYCTDDLRYQRYRKIVHHPSVQWLWLHLPRFLRKIEARRLRTKSQNQTKQKPASWTDVNPSAIEAAMQAAGVARMIHGHTHRPALHEHVCGLRHVLPDWHQGKGGYLLRDDGRWRLCHLDGSVMTCSPQDLSCADA
ncbi:UDP-2,3-diacylglucosamine hydrolase [Formivibrio citricus]|uniref:UDP-2,3-diacylglucosamine hydrolase n=1 Tax=Formivibrio citricus TaxID=83765 RepID=A0A1I4YM44_9NEIS|nr:UDP-2,3-diacylglucosamine diphosphatase [Formivibrio citricus]SFN39118.1 UDP-2,3-diacylglucosamine hydrolase [Formivibrio citricus]